MPLSNTIQSPSRITSSQANAITNHLSTTASLIAPANTSRVGLTIFNSLSQTIYLGVSNTVTTSSYMVQIPAGFLYELPLPYTGDFYAVLASGTGSAQVREFVI